MRLLHWYHPIQLQAPPDRFLQRLELVIRAAANPSYWGIAFHEISGVRSCPKADKI